MTEEQQSQKSQQSEESEEQPQMKGDDVVETNAGDDATQGTIADSSDEPTKAGE